MSAAPVVPMAVAVNPNREADRVIYTFGEHSFGLTVEDALLLANHTMAAVDALRPMPALGLVQ